KAATATGQSESLRLRPATKCRVRVERGSSLASLRRKAADNAGSPAARRGWRRCREEPPGLRGSHRAIGRLRTATLRRELHSGRTVRENPTPESKTFLRISFKRVVSLPVDWSPLTALHTARPLVS